MKMFYVLSGNTHSISNENRKMYFFDANVISLCLDIETICA